MVLLSLAETSVDGAGAVDHTVDDSSSKSDPDPAARDQVREPLLVHSRRLTQVEGVKEEQLSMADYIVSSTNHADGKYTRG